MKIDIQGNQSKKIEMLKKQGGKLLACAVRIKMRDGRIATINDFQQWDDGYYIVINVLEISEDAAKRWDGALHGM